MLVAQQRFGDPFDRLFEVFGAAETKAEYLVKEDKEAWVYELEMPGVPKESLQIQALGRELRIEGKRGETKRQYSLILPATACREGIKASLDLGILRLVVPKTLPTSVQIAVD